MDVIRAGEIESGVGRRRTAKPAAERRQEIVDSALALFREKGYGETTVQDVAEAADVATGTIYIHFPSKEHILAAIHETFRRAQMVQMADYAAGMLERRLGGEPITAEEAIAGFCDAARAFLLGNKEACEVVMTYRPRPELLQAEHEFIQFLARAIEQGVAQGVFEISDPEMAARLVYGAMTSTAGSAAAFGDLPELDRVLAAAREVFTKALAPGRVHPE